MAAAEGERNKETHLKYAPIKEPDLLIKLSEREGYTT